MNLHRIAVLLALLVSAAPCFDALGQQAWPARPLRMLVPYGPGSGPDVVGRLVGAELQTRLGQPVIVENRVGVGGKLGVEAAAKAKGDPYTLFLGVTDTQCILPHFYPTWEVKPAADLVGISPIVFSTVLISANPALPVSNIQELIRYAKANPGVPYGSAGRKCYCDGCSAGALTTLTVLAPALESRDFVSSVGESASPLFAKRHHKTAERARIARRPAA